MAVGMTLGSTAIGVGVRWATIRGTTLGTMDLMAMAGIIRGMILGTTATTVGAIPIITVGMAAMVGGIPTGTILTTVGASVAMPIMERLVHATMETPRTIPRVVRLMGVRTVIPVVLSAVRATAAWAIAAQPHAAIRVLFRVARMAVTAIQMAISAVRVRLRVTTTLRRVPATRRVIALRRTPAVRRRVTAVVAVVSVAHAVAVPLAVAVAVAAADLAAAGN